LLPIAASSTLSMSAGPGELTRNGPSLRDVGSLVV